MKKINSKEVFAFFNNFSKNHILLQGIDIKILKKGDIFMAHNIDNQCFWSVIGHGMLDEQLNEVIEQLHESYSFNVEKEGVYEVKLLVYFDEDGFEITDSEAKFLYEISGIEQEFLSDNDYPFD